MVHRHDPRYVDMFVKEICFGKENTAQTPAADDTSNDNSEPLEQDQISRSHVPRCLFLSRDRADITYIHSERIVSTHDKPYAAEPGARQIFQRRQAVGQVFGYNQNSTEVTSYSDSGWAGCQGTRMSSSVGVILLDSRMFGAHTRKQHIIVMSNAEAD